MSTPKAPPCDIPCPAKQALPWQHITSRAAHYRRCAAAPQLHKAPQLGPPNLNLCVAGQAGAAKGSAAGAAPRMPFLYPIGLRIANADPSRAAPELNEAPELHPPNLELCVAGQAGAAKGVAGAAAAKLQVPVQVQGVLRGAPQRQAVRAPKLEEVIARQGHAPLVPGPHLRLWLHSTAAVRTSRIRLPAWQAYRFFQHLERTPHHAAHLRLWLHSTAAVRASRDRLPTWQVPRSFQYLARTPHHAAHRARQWTNACRPEYLPWQ